MGSKCALQSRAPPTAAGPGLLRAGASAPHAGPCRPGGVGAQDCIPAGRRTSHPCQTSVPVLGSREWPGWRRGWGAQGPFVGGSTDDVTPTWDQSPWASALGSRPPSSPSSVPDLEPGESQPAAQGASARVTVCAHCRPRAGGAVPSGSPSGFVTSLPRCRPSPHSAPLLLLKVIKPCATASFLY